MRNPTRTDSEAVHHLQRVGADREQGGVEGGVDDGEARLAQGGDAAHAAQHLRQRVDDGVAPHVVQHRCWLEPVERVPVGLVGHAARASHKAKGMGPRLPMWNSMSTGRRLSHAPTIFLNGVHRLSGKQILPDWPGTAFPPGTRPLPASRQPERLAARRPNNLGAACRHPSCAPTAPGGEASVVGLAVHPSPAWDQY